MVKLSAAAKGAGSSYLNKTWTVIILAVALVYAALTLLIGNPLESRGYSKKQLDSAFAVFVITLCFTGMALSKDKNATLESDIEQLLRESQKPKVSDSFQVKLLTYIIGTPDEIAKSIDGGNIIRIEKNTRTILKDNEMYLLTLVKNKLHDTKVEVFASGISNF